MLIEKQKCLTACGHHNREHPAISRIALVPYSTLLPSLLGHVLARPASSHSWHGRTAVLFQGSTAAMVDPPHLLATTLLGHLAG
eukprot:16388490-Heterocapsa_arctica.AAC.1